MDMELNTPETEKVRLTNIVGETKKMIQDETDYEKGTNKHQVTDTEVKKAVERINPDPNSLKSRG